MTRLLLVDDEKDNLLLFKEILNDVGFIVDTYHTPVQALLTFKPNYYDLLIFDYVMPQLNGIELFNKMQEIDRSPKLMLLTASHEQLSDNSGQFEFKVVRKPVKITDFLQEINAILATDDKSQQIVNTTT